MIKVNDKLFRWLIVIIPFLVGVSAEGLADHPFDSKWIPRVITSLVTIILVCEGNRFIIYSTRPYFRQKVSSSIRLLIVIIAGLTFTTIILSINMAIESYLLFDTWKPLAYSNSSISLNNRKLPIGLFGIALFKAVALFIPLLLMNEGIYHLAKLRATEKDKERLEKDKLKAELQQLKGIVNPHFLFNNLNSLSSLISEDPVKAEAFLDEFTKVFRYLLRNNENELTTLRQEIEFIQSYFHLLRSRYGDGIELLYAIDERYDVMMVPPLTLQLLIENAVKHNRIQKENPLQIELSALPDNRLLVRNNIVRKAGKVESTGIGLQSINARYRMLNQPNVTVNNDDRYFSVTIPLVS